MEQIFILLNGNKYYFAKWEQYLWEQKLIIYLHGTNIYFAERQLGKNIILLNGNKYLFY
jgi:hypothetical protein